MLNRHGLVAGATGTGKTKTLQGLAGQLSRAGVPTFIADVKGDLTGLAAPGDGTNQKIIDRAAQLGVEFVPSGHPVELLSLSGKLGAQVRATVSSFGPLLLSRILDLNKTQTSVLSLVFKYCDDHDLPLLDLADLKTTLKFLVVRRGQGGPRGLRRHVPRSIGVIQRALVNLEQQGADAFFGEPAFEVEDLLRTRRVGAVIGADGQLTGGEEQGIVHLLEISDVMDRPKLFSTFMLWMLAQLYQALPEAGDLPKPKLVFFFDEAHLLFEDASEALLDQVEQTVRLIRSKGVGVFFVTQTPTDVPSSVLAQLGNRIQHALRVFTPEDADLLKKTVRTFPMTDYFDVGETITSLGTGEALVTVLSPRGIPTALAPTRIAPPDSLMAALPADQIQARISNSPLYAEYGQSIDRESAHEILSARIAAAKAAVAGATTAPGRADADAGPGAPGDRGPGEGAGEDPARGGARREGRRAPPGDGGGRRPPRGGAGGPAAGQDDRRGRDRPHPRRLRDALRQLGPPPPLSRGRSPGEGGAIPRRITAAACPHATSR